MGVFDQLWHLVGGKLKPVQPDVPVEIPGSVVMGGTEVDPTTGITTPSIATEAIGADFEIIAPDDHFAVVGVEANIWLDSLIKEVAGKDLINWDVAQSGSAGSHIDGKWVDTPADTTDDESTTTFSAYDSAGNLLSSKAMTYHVAPATSHGAVNLLYMGDSTVAGAQIIADLAVFDAADASLSLAFVGTLDDPNFNEGYSGQTVSWFYTHADSPFTKDGAWNYAAYLTDNSLATPDVIVIQLGINDVFGQTTDAGVAAIAAANITKLEAMITSFLAVNNGTKVLLNLVTLPSDQTKMGGDYGVGQTLWRVKRNNQLYNKALLAHTWNRCVTLLPVGLNIDIANNMYNGVHPTADGYQDISDVVYAWIKNEVPVDIGWHNAAYNAATRSTLQTNGTLSGDILTSTKCDTGFGGLAVTYKASEKTIYDIATRIHRPIGSTHVYLGILLWDGANAVDYNLPSGSDGVFTTYLGKLNYRLYSLAVDAWSSITTSIDLSLAPDFTHISLYFSGEADGCPAGVTAWAEMDLSVTSLKKR